MQRSILLRKNFEKNILTRSSVSELFDKKINVMKNNKISIDFKGITFISRSAAAEYLKQKKISNKDISEKNMSKDIRLMFALIIKQLSNRLIVKNS